MHGRRSVSGRRSRCRGVSISSGFCFYKLPTLIAPAQTAREEFAELKQANGVPKWAHNVCFTEQVILNDGSAVDADLMDSSNAEFVLLGYEGPRTMLGQWFFNGVPVPANALRIETTCFACDYRVFLTDSELLMLMNDVCSSTRHEAEFRKRELGVGRWANLR